MASSSTHCVDIKTTEVQRILKRRERNGAFEYKVEWKNRFRIPCWRSPSTLDCPDLIQAYDALLLGIDRETERLMAHEAKKIENMKILDESIDGTKFWIAWSGNTWEERYNIPTGIILTWEEEKLLKTPSPRK